MNRRETIMAILEKKTSDNRKASELEHFMADEMVNLAKRLWDVEKTHGPKWIENVKRAAMMEFDKRDYGHEQEPES